MADPSGWIPVLIGIAFIILIPIAFFAVATKFYHKVEQGTALIINTRKATPKVTFRK